MANWKEKQVQTSVEDHSFFRFINKHDFLLFEVRLGELSFDEQNRSNEDNESNNNWNNNNAPGIYGTDEKNNVITYFQGLCVSKKC